MNLRIIIFILLLLVTPFMLEQINVHGETTPSTIINIDLFKKKLYVIEEKQVLHEYPIAIGTELSPTPVGQFQIIEKSKAWGGGFGSRWLGLDVPWGVYGIHGTNKPYLIGEHVSSGCIRMNNNDVEQLYEMIPIGTKVHIEGVLTGTGEGELANLAIGSKGNLVLLVQNRLKAMGIYNGNMDGIYDIGTYHAIREFQKSNNLTVNGVVAFREYLLLGLLE